MTTNKLVPGTRVYCFSVFFCVCIQDMSRSRLIAFKTFTLICFMKKIQIFASTSPCFARFMQTTTPVARSQGIYTRIQNYMLIGPYDIRADPVLGAQYFRLHKYPVDWRDSFGPDVTWGLAGLSHFGHQVPWGHWRDSVLSVPMYPGDRRDSVLSAPQVPCGLSGLSPFSHQGRSIFFVPQQPRAGTVATAMFFSQFRAHQSATCQKR